MAQHGGKRPGAGRKPGAKNRATRKMKKTFAEMAQDHAPSALQTLVEIMTNPDESASSRVAAANSIFDRAYGKPAQAVDLSSKDGSMTPVLEFVIGGDEPDHQD